MHFLLFPSELEKKETRNHVKSDLLMYNLHSLHFTHLKYEFK